jgi:hypothetical protein
LSLKRPGRYLQGANREWKAMRACVKETGSSKLFSANITTDDPAEMIARGKCCLSQFGPLGECCALSR